MSRPIARPISRTLRPWIGLSAFFLILSGFWTSPASAQQVITTFSKGAPGDPFNAPSYLAFDKFGNLFVSDKGNHRVQRIDKQTGAVTTVVGTGTAGYFGDGGPATQALVNCPQGLAFDGVGSLYVADQCANVVRKVTTGADSAITGANDEIISSFAGNGTAASCSLASGTASQTPINAPSVLVTDQAGNLFMVAGETLTGSCSQLVQRVDAASGLLTTVAIIGPSPNNPGMAFDPSGNLFVWEFQSTGLMCPPAALLQSADPFAGNPLCQSAFNGPTAINGVFAPPAMVFDTAGNLYASNDDCGDGCAEAIFKLTPASGVIGFDATWSVYAGTQNPGYSGDGGPPLNATFNTPIGLAFDDAGDLFIADSRNNVIRMVSAGPGAPILKSFPANPTNQSAATFTFTDSDPTVTSFVCTLDGVANPCSSPATYSGLSDGSHTFSVAGKTSAGTTTNAVSYTWVVDTVPPPMPSIDSHPPDPSATANATFTFSDTEAGTSFTCSLDGSAAFCSGAVIYPGLADGSHTFSVTAKDAAGNQSAANVFSWTIHTTTPPPPNIDSAPAALSNQGAPAFSFSDAQAGVTFTCQLDTAQPALCTSPAVFVGLPDGVHNFLVIANDPVSGRSSASTSFTWTKDTIAPTVDCCTGSATVVIPAPAIFFFRSSATDVVSFLCSLDGAPFVSCTSPAELPIPTPGDHTFAVKAVDAAGNVGDPSFGGVHVTYCSCEAPGDYTSPEFGPDHFGFTVPPDQPFQILVSRAADGTVATQQLVDTRSGSVVYELPATARSFRWSPDGTHLAFISGVGGGGSDPFNPGTLETTMLDLTSSPARSILTIFGGGDGHFSPTGAYWMNLQTLSATQALVSLYRIADVSQGNIVYSNTFTFSSVPEALWGFSPSAGGPERAFMYFFVSANDNNTITWNVVNLANGKLTLSQSVPSNFPLDLPHWLFNPCGTIIAFLNNVSPTIEGVQLFDTEIGGTVGQTSFPVQPVTISSALDPNRNLQEVAKIGSPQQTIVLGQRPCGGNTPIGTNVSTTPVCSPSNSSPVSVTFSAVSQAGGTGVIASPTGNAPPGNFQLGDPPVYYDIATSATYSGDITICINYAGITFPGSPRLFHFENGAWVDRTTSVDTVTQTVCGVVSSLSPFALFAEPVPQLPAITSASSTTFQAGTSASFTIHTTGSPTPTLSESGTLPAGISFVDNHDGSGLLTGIPAAGGTFNLTLSATNAAGNATQSFTLTVASSNHPPTANAGPNQTVEATSPAGAAVTLSGSGTDPDNDPLTFAWSENGVPLGAGAQIVVTLPIGVHTITLTANDGRGGTGTAMTLVTVRDTTPPVVTPPVSITVPATEAGGARGSAWPALSAFLAAGSAIDIADPVPASLAPQVSGVNVDNTTLFPFGVTTVNFRFRDASGNMGTTSATVTVILGTIRIAAQVAGQGRNPDGTFFVDVKFTNIGTGNARKLRLGEVEATPIRGGGRIVVISPAFPLTVGNGSLDAGASQTVRIILKVPLAVKQFELEEEGSFANVQGVPGFLKEEETVTP